jgi:hypothetical protein
MQIFGGLEEALDYFASLQERPSNWEIAAILRAKIIYS